MLIAKHLLIHLKTYISISSRSISSVSHIYRSIYIGRNIFNQMSHPCISFDGILLDIVQLFFSSCFLSSGLCYFSTRHCTCFMFFFFPSRENQTHALIMHLQELGCDGKDIVMGWIQPIFFALSHSVVALLASIRLSFCPCRSQQSLALPY